MYLTHGNAWYPLFSETFRYLTCTPLIVKYGISKLTLKIGEVNVFLSSAIEGKLNFILAHSALPPGSDFMIQIIDSNSGEYVMEPASHFISGDITSLLTGILITILFAVLMDQH